MARKGRRRRNHKIWSREWILKKLRLGAYQNLMTELRLFDNVSYTHFLRMDPSTFENLLKLVAPLITKKDTIIRKAIPAGERLALTLRLLATGNMFSFTKTENQLHILYIVAAKSQTYTKILICNNASSITLGENYTSLQYLYRIPRQTIGQIVQQVCEALTMILKDYMKVNYSQILITNFPFYKDNYTTGVFIKKSVLLVIIQ